MSTVLSFRFPFSARMLLMSVPAVVMTLRHTIVASMHIDEESTPWTPADGHVKALRRGHKRKPDHGLPACPFLFLFFFLWGATRSKEHAQWPVVV